MESQHIFSQNKLNSEKQLIYLTGEVPINDYITTHLPSSTYDFIFLKKEDLTLGFYQYQNAYYIEQNILKYDINIAKQIHINKIRRLRDAKFPPLDVAFMRAVERGDTAKQQEIAAEKQKLRDITAHPAIDAATTLEELHVLTIDILLSMTTITT